MSECKRHKKFHFLMFKMIVANHTFTNADYAKNDFSINSIMTLSKMKKELNLIFKITLTEDAIFRSR